VPWFIAGVLLLAAIRFTGVLPLDLVLGVKEFSRWLTILAMAGLGLGVEFAAIRSTGPRVLVAVCGSWSS